MDVGAVKAPTIQRSQTCKRSRQSVSTSQSRFFKSTELTRQVMESFAAGSSAATFCHSSKSYGRSEMLGPIAVAVGRSAASAIARPSALARQA